MNEVDALIDLLRRDEPGLYSGLTLPSKRYAWIAETLANAQSSVDTFAEQIQCCRQAALKEGISL